MPNGYNGKILHINLSTGRFEIEEPPESFYRKYMGGSAFGLYYLLKEMNPYLDPLSPDAIITFMLSVTTGAPISGQSRLNINAKSPMSHAIGDSQSGGFFPAELKFAGLDGIVVTGRSENPVYLTVIDGIVKLHDAKHLSGKLTGEVDEIIKTELGEPKAQVLQYGPAAENGVRFASIVSMANRNNGRTGMGLVMASKNLKAIVARGNTRPNIYDSEKLVSLARMAPELMSTNPDVDGLGKYGTASVLLPQNLFGSLPTRNYVEGQFEACEDISGERLYDTILKKRATCYACVVRCKRVVEVVDNEYAVDSIYGGPEYETLGAFGSYCGVKDLRAISKANEMCNAYGVDTITCGATIAFAMECFEKGMIGLDQTDGIELRYGDAGAMLLVLRRIVMKEGKLGATLAEGSQLAAEIWGEKTKSCLITVKGQEAPAHMPQSKKSLALIYAVNPFGADHQSSEHDWMYEEGTSELYLSRLGLLGLNAPPAPGSFGVEKVRFATLTQHFYSMLDALGLCQFVFGPAWTLYGPEETVKFVNAVTGWNVSISELMEVGARRLNMLRAFNAINGFDRKDDTLPEKFFTPLSGTGPTSGVAVDRQDFKNALDMYYQLNGWTENGNPTQAKMNELQIGWVYDHNQFTPV